MLLQGTETTDCLLFPAHFSSAWESTPESGFVIHMLLKAECNWSHILYAQGISLLKVSLLSLTKPDTVRDRKNLRDCLAQPPRLILQMRKPERLRDLAKVIYLIRDRK